MNVHIICPDFELPEEIEATVREKAQKLAKLPHDLLDVDIDIRQTASGTPHSDTLIRVGVSARKDTKTYYADEKARNVRTATNQAVNEAFKEMQRENEKRREKTRQGNRQLKDKMREG